MEKYSRTGIVLNKNDKEFCVINNLKPTHILREAIQKLRMDSQALKIVEEQRVKIQKLVIRYEKALIFIAKQGLSSKFSDESTENP